MGHTSTLTDFFMRSQKEGWRSFSLHLVSLFVVDVRFDCTTLEKQLVSSCRF